DGHCGRVRACHARICVVIYAACYFLFFFSSRRRHTSSTRDWSSDVCSSDLSDGPRRSMRPTTRSTSAGHPTAMPINRSSSHLPEIGKASCRERGQTSWVWCGRRKKKYSDKYTNQNHAPDNNSDDVTIEPEPE